MDASALRWVLAIIGVVLIVGIYLYSLYQDKLRRRAAIKTFTREELESGFIEDDDLRKELSSINTLLDEEFNQQDLGEIQINPGMEAEARQAEQAVVRAELPLQLVGDTPHCVAHVLKRANDRLITAHECREAFIHGAFQRGPNGLYQFITENDDILMLADLTASGSFDGIDDEAYSSPGLVCYFEIRQSLNPLGCYDVMLKKIDELVRLLDLKVYSQDLELLTLQHVTTIREQLKGEQ